MGNRSWDNGSGGEHLGSEEYRDEFLSAAYASPKVAGRMPEVSAEELALLMDPGLIVRPGQELAPVMTIGDWVKAILLMLIPGVNLVMMVLWASGRGHNPNLANLARALWACVGTVLVLIGLGIWIIYLIGGFSMTQ